RGRGTVCGAPLDAPHRHAAACRIISHARRNNPDPRHFPIALGGMQRAPSRERGDAMIADPTPPRDPEHHRKDASLPKQDNSTVEEHEETWEWDGETWTKVTNCRVPE